MGCWEWRGPGPLEGVHQKMQAMWLWTHLRLRIVWDLELHALSAIVGTLALLMAQEEKSECLYSSFSSSGVFMLEDHEGLTYAPHMEMAHPATHHFPLTPASFLLHKTLSLTGS